MGPDRIWVRNHGLQGIQLLKRLWQARRREPNKDRVDIDYLIRDFRRTTVRTSDLRVVYDVH